MHAIRNNLTVNIQLHMQMILQINFLYLAANDILPAIEAVQINFPDFIAFQSECNGLPV
ncbi:hypothetical protein D3C74_442260 [compost metagenome]